MRRRAGFTLIETMLVVAIAGVLTSLAVAGLQDTIAATSETRAARAVAQLMKRARATAVATHQRVAVRANTTLHSIELASCPQRFGQAACVGGTVFAATAGGSIPFSTEFHGVKVDVPTADGDGNAVVFNADGFPASAVVWRFDHPHTTGAQEVVTSVGGDVRIQSSATPVSTDEL